MHCKLAGLFWIGALAALLLPGEARSQDVSAKDAAELRRDGANDSGSQRESKLQEVAFRLPKPAPVPAEGVGAYIPGGHNVMARQYRHSAGYPAFPERAKFVGTLTGDWYEMGKQFGARSGDSVRCVSEIWWRKQCGLWGKAETFQAMRLYEDQIRALDPALIGFMKGIADGAAPWLDQSPFARKDDPLYATNYQRVLAVNLHDEWSMRHPHRFPDGSSTYGGTARAPIFTVPPPHMCSGFSARGKATSQGQVIAAENRQCGYDPRCYQQVYVVRPKGGNACWVLTNCPQVAANQVVNDHGVSLALFAGGRTNKSSLDYQGEDYVAEGFGVPWFHLFLYVGTHANTAEEAIEMLTVGTLQYRERTGRKTLLRGGGWIFLVTDPRTMAVVEVTADRYAVRRPGQFTGTDWTDPDYIVATNHNLCDYSFDAENHRTDIPMTIFGDGYRRDSATGKVTGLTGSGVRFWTLMWDMKHHYGRIDKLMAQRIMSGLYACDWKSGEKIECAQDASGNWRVWGTIKSCNQGSVSLRSGSADGKVAVLRGAETAVHWTLGSPSHWQGAWDEYQFRQKGNQSK